MHGLRLYLLAFALLAGGVVRADDAPEFQKYLNSRLVFEENRDNPQLLEVYLHLDNVGDQNRQWSANSINGLEVTVTDAQGHSPPPPPGAMFGDIATSLFDTYFLPPGSRMDWRLTFHFGISTAEPKPDEYRLQIGNGVWNIPKSTIGNYQMKIRLKGWLRVPPGTDGKFLQASQIVLFDLPAQKIVLTPRAAE